MLILYDTAHSKLCGLDNYSDLYVEQAVGNSTTPIVLDQMHFRYPQEDARCKLIDYECYVGTEDAEYIVKEINLQTAKDGITWVEYVCDLNVEPLKGTLIDNFAPGSTAADAAANLALAGTGWSVGYCDVTKRRTAAGAHVTAFGALEDIAKAFSCEIEFRTAEKQVDIHQKIGTNRGVYFAEQLNLRSLQVQGNSRDYCTRLYPIGKNGMTIASVNGGVAYVSNYQYATKVISAYWIDNRYTVPADMLADAQERLDYLSKPVRAYSADLSRLDGVSIGDTITLLAESIGVREQQRVVKIDRYPEEPERSTCEISNRLASLDDIVLRVSDAADTVSDATDPTGAVMGSNVQVSNSDGSFDPLNVAFQKVGTLIAGKIEASEADIRYANLGDFTALQGTVIGKFTAYDSQFHTIETDYETVNGTITALDTRTTTLETDSATVRDQLTTLNATVEGKLDASEADIRYATIEDMNVANGYISNLQGDNAKFLQVLADGGTFDDLTAGTATANYAALLHGTLGDAQIGSLSVAKLLAGIISTDKFTVQSDAGNLSISGNTLHVWDDAGKERVSLGLNGSDYNLTVRGADGETVLYGPDGVTHAGITAGAVDDSKVASGANINGSKIDQESLVSRINGATTLLNSSRIKYDPTGQTLNVAFDALKTTVTDQGETLTSQGTAISAVQGQISGKVWQTDIDTAVSGLSGSGRNLIIDHTVKFVTYIYNGGTATVDFVADDTTASGYRYDITITALGSDGMFKGYLSQHFSPSFVFNDHNIYTFSCKMKCSANRTIPVLHQPISTVLQPINMTTEYQKITVTGANNNSYHGFYYANNATTLQVGDVISICDLKLESGPIATGWSPAPEDTQSVLDTITTTISTHSSEIEQAQSDIALRVQTSTYQSDKSAITGDISDLQSRMHSAELKITDSAIVSTVTASSQWSGISSRLDTAESKITPSAITLTVKQNLGGADIASIINATATAVTISTSNFKVAATSIDLVGMVNALNGLTTTTLYAQKLTTTGSAAYGTIGTAAVGSTTYNGLSLYDGAYYSGSMLVYNVDSTNHLYGVRMAAPSYSTSGQQNDSYITLYQGAATITVDKYVDGVQHEGYFTIVPFYDTPYAVLSLDSLQLRLQTPDGLSLSNGNGAVFSVDTAGSTTAHGDIIASGANMRAGGFLRTTDGYWAICSDNVSSIRWSGTAFDIMTGSTKYWISPSGGSDERLKAGIIPSTADCLSTVKSISLIEYTMLEDGSHVMAGVSAQNLMSINNQFARPFMERGGITYYAPRWDSIGPYLIGALQQVDDNVIALAQRADSLTVRDDYQDNDIAVLKAQIISLQAQIDALKTAA